MALAKNTPHTLKSPVIANTLNCLSSKQFGLNSTQEGIEKSLHYLLLCPNNNIVRIK